VARERLRKFSERELEQLRVKVFETNKLLGGWTWELPEMFFEEHKMNVFNKDYFVEIIISSWFCLFRIV
jgi:hypothetical protein